MTHRTRSHRRPRRLARAVERLLAGLLAVHVATGCNPEVAELLVSQSPEAQAGVRDHQRALLVRVPGGLANAAGGNLYLRAAGLSLETALGPEEVTAVYNSADAAWRFGFIDMRYDGAAFLDQTGARHAVAELADGAAIPGTVWVKVDASTIRSKGGLVFEFGAQGELTARRRIGQACPRIAYVRAPDGDPDRIAIRQQDCGSRGEWSTYHTELFAIDLDSDGRIEQVTDRAGRVALYGWDAAGNLLEARDGLDVERDWPGTRFEYGTASGRPELVTSSEGERIAYEWYAPTLLGTPRLERARQVALAGEGDLALRFDYHPTGSDGIAETVVTDPAGDRRRYAFDADRRIHSVAYEAVGEQESYAYEGAELYPASYTGTDGATESYLRNEDGDVVELTRPSGNVVRYTYTDANNVFPFDRALLSKDDDLGTIASWEYSNDSPVDYRRLTSVTNGAGEVTRYAWHPGAGYTRLASVTGPGGVVRSLDAYNALGQATQVTVGELVAARAFDAMGNQTSGDAGIAPEIGGVRERRYDADRNPVAVTVVASDGVESEIRIDRGSDGRILSIDRPPAGLGIGDDHRFQYDTLGRLVSREERVDGTWVATAYEYDARGHRTALSLPNGMRREWLYDQRGRVVRQRALRDGELESEASFHYSGGQLVAVGDSERGVVTYGYDAAGRRDLILHPGGESVELGYDARSRLVRETFLAPDGSVLREIEREYDLADREIRLLDGGERVLERDYTDGRLECVETGNALRRCFGYDPQLGLRASAETRDGGGVLVETTTLEQAQVAAPPAWEIATVTDVPELGSAESAFRIGPTSDPSFPTSQVGKRLLEWERAGGATHHYAYDALSNPVDDADGDVFAYNAEGNRLLAATVDGTAVQYTWDAAGFADSRDGVAIEWTATGRMAAYGPYEVEWDALGRPLRAIDASSGTPVVRDWTRFGGRIETDASGALVALDLGEVVLAFDGSRRYRHLDFRDNVAFVSDDSGDVITLYEYGPYGVASLVGDAGDGVRFVGRNEIGPFLWLGERMLDPLVGRFLSPDPVFHLLNQYTYTFGNPIWFTDPTGRTPDGNQGSDLVAVAVAVAGFALALASVVVASPTVAPALAVLGLVVATVSLIITITNIQWSAPAPPRCPCEQRIEFGPTPATPPRDAPAGALPAGTSLGEAASGLAGGGLGGGAFDGFGGGLGAPVSCGLTGFEFALFVAYLIVRRKRRTAR